MKRKNTIVKILAAVLTAATLALSFAACGAPAAGTPEDTTPGSTPAPEKPYDPGVDVLSFNLSDHITLGAYRDIKITLNTYCDDAMLDEHIKIFAEQEGYYSEVKDRVTKEGDVLNIAFKGSIEGIYF